MKARYLHLLTVTIVVIGLVFIAFLYSTEPRSLAEVTTKTQVALGTYEVDAAEFENGLAAFRRDEFQAARISFELADPEKRDAATQFYIAYSYYRQGWGRLSNDDTLFRSGVERVNTVVDLDPKFQTKDNTLGLKTAAELKNELEEGLKVTPSDFNPLRLTRERK